MSENPKVPVWEYDYTDPAIRDLVERHRPIEDFFSEGTLSRIYCDVDGQRWPCQAWSGYRTWAEAQRESKP